MADPASRFYLTKAPYLVNGSRALGHKPYLALTGTSMASPVVAGTVALMLQANPSLTPNAVKAILQYTSHPLSGVNYLTQGAGVVNAYGAVKLARYFANPAVRRPDVPHLEQADHLGQPPRPWRQVEAERQRLGDQRGVGHRARSPARTLSGARWMPPRTSCGARPPTARTSSGARLRGGENIVWGTDCGGADCRTSSGAPRERRLARTSSGAPRTALENIVWGTADAGENIVWGTSGDSENIVWGTASSALENVVWGTAYDGGERRHVGQFGRRARALR